MPSRRSTATADRSAALSSSSTAASSTAASSAATSSTPGFSRWRSETAGPAFASKSAILSSPGLRRSADQSKSARTSGFKQCRGTPPATMSSSSSAMMRPWCTAISAVLPPRWGVAMTLSMASSGWSEAGGSSANTSSPAPPSLPSRNASTSASSSTSAARAVLISIAPGFMAASRSAFIIPRVCSFTPACRLTTSERSSSSSRPTSSASWRAASRASTAGSDTSRRQPKPRSRRATSRPTAPRPTSPTVRFHSSAPRNRLKACPMRPMSPATEPGCLRKSPPAAL